MSKIWGWVVLITLATTAACQSHPQKPANPPEFADRCGDGRCTNPESPLNCPDDCAVIEEGARVPATSDPGLEAPEVSVERPLLYLGIMVHLEGWEDDRDEEKFIRHAELVREYAALFEQYGGKLTWESKELTDGSIKWGDNVLLEMEQRGHGIGVHADIGGSQEYDCDRFVRDLRIEREQLESLGVQVRHVSGNTSHCDWVTATIRAGYEFTTGTVAYNVMSMPEAQRPPAYRNCTTPSECHEMFPEAMEDRLHPWRAKDGSNWLEHDPEGKLVILASDGGLNCIQEELEGGVTGACVFNRADIQFLVQQVEAALSIADPDQVNQIYFSWSLGQALDVDVMEALLRAISPYVESGQVAWATLPEVYDAYVAWEQSRDLIDP